MLCLDRRVRLIDLLLSLLAQARRPDGSCFPFLYFLLFLYICSIWQAHLHWRERFEVYFDQHVGKEEGKEMNHCYL
jgi:hypothetical protein